LNEPLRVMSFNIRYGDAPDGPNSWPFRRDAVMETIRGFDPDILALQEALDFQNDEITDFFPAFTHIGIGRDDGQKQGEFASIFCNGQRLTEIDSGTFWFSAQPLEPGSRHPECHHPRICTWAAFDDGFSIYNLHLDNVSSVSRLMAVDQLLGVLKHEVGTLVTGDFNAGEADRCIERLRQAGYRDTFRSVQPNEQDSGTYHGYSDIPEPDKIDYIWADASWTILDAAIVRDRFNDQWPSDHYPVTAIVDRKPRC
jgi:endonuclease/exonuclease/phosphatase family metal-dependent hydrolase